MQVRRYFIEPEGNQQHNVSVCVKCTLRREDDMSDMLFFLVSFEIAEESCCFHHFLAPFTVVPINILELYLEVVFLLI